MLSLIAVSLTSKIQMNRFRKHCNVHNFGLFKQRWEFSSEEVEFHLSHGAWVELLRDNGFTVERLLELGAPKNSESRYGWADPEWAAKWPTEEVWCVFLSKS